MKRIVLAASIAAILLTSAAASAGTLIVTPPATDGSFTGMYGSTTLPTGAFTDIYNFTLPTGLVAWTISSIFNSNENNNVDFSAVTFNGVNFQIASTGDFESRYLLNQSVTAGPQTLVVSGVNGMNGSYAGTLSFTSLAAGVPEPATWGLMMLGFGGLGALARTRRRQAALAA